MSNRRAPSASPIVGEAPAKRAEGGRSNTQAPDHLRAPHFPTPSPQRAISCRALLITALATGACSVRLAPATWVVTTTDESRETFVQALREFAEAEGYDFRDEVAVSDSGGVTLQEAQERQDGIVQMRMISLQNSRSMILVMNHRSGDQAEPNKFDVSVMGTPLPWALSEDELAALTSRIERAVLSSPGLQVERFTVPGQSRR